MRVQAIKEAKLREVLAEVSVVDVGRKLKSLAGYMGCYLVFMIGIVIVTSLSKGAGYDFDQTGGLAWGVWLLIGWSVVHGTTSDRSFHELNASLYFPKLNWFGSLLLTAYIVGFVYLFLRVSEMEVGIERGAVFTLVMVGYVFPFVLFLSIITVGHANLIEKRVAAAGGSLS